MRRLTVLFENETITEGLATASPPVADLGGGMGGCTPPHQP